MNDLKIKTAIVTGAGGFIGGTLCKYLLKKGIQVVGIDINKKYLEELEKDNNFMGLVVNEITDLQKIKEFKLLSIDVFFHLAWGGSLLSKDLQNLELQLENVKMTINYVKEIIGLGCKKIVFGGSSYQYMIYNDMKINSNIYGMAKEMASKLVENECICHNVDCNIALLTNTYGYGDRSNKAVNTFIRKMHNNETIDLIEGNYQNDWVYIDDTIEGLYHIAYKGKSFKRYYIGHRDILKFKESLLLMKQVLNYQNELRFGKYPENTHVDYSQLDSRDLTIDTGFECKVDLATGILKTSEWLKQIDIK